uniref:AlNc14C427G11565 protein n=1 Tax=Albugo laibachii Nc14 TaxID=890382 RepID=F0WZG6_9STRA|nr:AlNc14C427G11565 [Albugo laibachii Nc14]|eukprot:CCA26886.1 AlNc14C427G11565 [Albugo laibachii Nc14]
MGRTYLLLRNAFELQIKALIHISVSQWVKKSDSEGIITPHCVRQALRFGLSACASPLRIPVCEQNESSIRWTNSPEIAWIKHFSIHHNFQAQHFLLNRYSRITRTIVLADKPISSLRLRIRLQIPLMVVQTTSITRR